MMKKILKYAVIAKTLFLFFGCNDNLLENNQIMQQASVDDIYLQMIEPGTGGTLSGDDFGQKGYDIFSDMLCGDMALVNITSNYDMYMTSITEFGAPLDYTVEDNNQVWTYYYGIINTANTLIQSLGGNDVIPISEEDRHTMGQAKGLRAYAYFYLTQFFQKEYIASEEILPLYLEAGTINLPKTTAGEIYLQIEEDLNDAISMLADFNRLTKKYLNQDVAKMLLAQVLGARGGNDVEIITLTQEVINSGYYNVLSTNELVAAANGVNGFDDIASPSWIWGFDVTTSNDLGPDSWWGQIDSWSYGYAWVDNYKVMDLDLYNAIQANDVRKTQFFGNPASDRYLQPLFKFRASDHISGASQTVTADYVYMRIEEAYLLNAEANANLGNEAAARTSLKAVMTSRVPGASYIDALSGQALKDEIYLQTRIELWGEGKSYLAMKRNKASATRGANHLSFVGVPIPYNDERMQFEIPQSVIENNPHINEQNQ